jgi:hypothetical protein
MALKETTVPERGTFFKFNAVGTSLDGQYVGEAEGTYGTEYTFRTQEGQDMTVNPPSLLRAAIRQAIKDGLKTGHRCIMKLTGEKPHEDPAKNATKIFKFAWDDMAKPLVAKKAPAPAAPTPQPADDDIPF